MKNSKVVLTSILLVLIAALFSNNLIAQSFLGQEVEIINRWTNTKLYEDNGKLYYGQGQNDKWVVVKVNEDGLFRIKNVATNHAINIENGPATVSDVGVGWNSAYWELESSDSDYFFVNNYWKDVSIHNQNQTGVAEVGEAPKNWWSAQWKFKALPKNTLYANRTLSAYNGEQSITSENGKYRFTFQEDGNAVLYDETNNALWATGSNGKGMSRIEMHADGRLNLVDNRANVIWSTDTKGQAGSVLVMQDDGNLCIYNTSGTPTWCSQTYGGRKSNLNVTGLWVAPTKSAPKSTPVATKPAPKSTPVVYTPNPPNSASFKWINNLDDKGGTSLKIAGSPEYWLRSASKGWMGKLRDETPVHQLSLPGTHNSASDTETPYVRCQAWTIKGQLEAGIRFLDLRVSRDGSKLRMVHGTINVDQTFDDVMNQISQFLRENPTEALVARIQEQSGNDDWDKSGSYSTIMASYQNTYDKYIYKGGNKKPSLKDLRGKIYFRKFNNSSDSNYTNDYGVGNGRVLLGKVTAVFGDGKVGGNLITFGEKQQKMFTGFITTIFERSKWNFNGIAVSGELPPEGGAAILNPVVNDYIGGEPRKKHLGIVEMDFPGEQLIYRIIASNFDNTALVVTIDKLNIIKAEEFSGDDIKLLIEYGGNEIETDEISNMDDGDSWSRTSSEEWSELDGKLYSGGPIKITVKENDSAGYDLVGVITIDPSKRRGTYTSDTLKEDDGELTLSYTIH